MNRSRSLVLALLATSLACAPQTESERRPLPPPIANGGAPGCEPDCYWQDIHPWPWPKPLEEWEGTCRTEPVPTGFFVTEDGGLGGASGMGGGAGEGGDGGHIRTCRECDAVPFARHAITVPQLSRPIGVVAAFQQKAGPVDGKLVIHVYSNETAGEDGCADLVASAEIEFHAPSQNWTWYCVEVQFEEQYRVDDKLDGFLEFGLPDVPAVYGLAVELTEWYPGGCPPIFRREQ